MSFYFPLGLIGLIGVPVLIIIYIIKSKYTEQTIASTYLWELSERFLKRRKPISKLTGIITLVLQILAVIAASFLIAHPVFTIPSSANDYYFILDGSASMNMSDGASTRFDRAKGEISAIIDGSRDGSTYTLIFASDATAVTFEDVTDKEQAKTYLGALSAGWNATDCSSAMAIAQDYFDKNPSAEVYLFTDKNYEVTNINLTDVSGGENNYAFTDCGYSFSGGALVVSGNAISYSEDTEATVELWLAQKIGEPQKAAETQVSLTAGEPVAFTLTSEATAFVSLEIRISSDDALAEDNSVILYDEAKTQQRRVLLINGSDDGAYLKNALAGSGKAAVTVIRGSEYEPVDDNGNKGGVPKIYSGYGMYVFNCYVPKELPKNAAIWLVNAVDGTGEGSGITYRSTQIPRDETGPGSYYTPEYVRNSNTKSFTEGLLGRSVAVRKYARYGVPRSFTTIMDFAGDPLICTGLNANNDRQVTFAFKIGDSSFGLSEDFLILVKNLMDYSFPAVIDDTVYDSGEVMNVNVVPGCEDIIITAPSQKSIVLDTDGKDICEVQLNETGTYKITVKVAGNNEDTVLYVFARVPESESRAEKEGGELVLNGTKEQNYSDGYYDELLAFFIAIALLLLADWGVYCYEQYQLR